MADVLGSAVHDAYQDPDTFCGLRLGSTKEDVEKVVRFTNYLDIEGARFTAGSTTLAFGGGPVAVSLNFERGHGLQAIHGGFSQLHYPMLKDTFLDVLGEPDELAIVEPSVVIVPAGMDFNEGFDPTIPVDSLLWYKKNNFVSLQNRTTGRAFAHLRVATYRYMKSCGAWMMGERARHALVAAGELSVPPPDWLQEPQQFESLKFGMTMAEAEQVIDFGERFQAGLNSTAVRVPLVVSSVAAVGRLDFHADRLISLSGEFDIPGWLAIKAIFVERYGSPHYFLEKARTEWGRFEELYWISDWIQIGLTGSPDGLGVGRFHLAPSSHTFADYLQTQTHSVPGDRTRYRRS